MLKPTHSAKKKTPSFGQFFLANRQFFEVLQIPNSEGPLASENIKEPRQRLWESIEVCIEKKPRNWSA